jgi:Protein of unknown function (DUF1598)
VKKLHKLAAGLALVLVLTNCTIRDPIPRTVEEIRAVSLKSLQQTLKTCLPNNSCPSEALELGGIRKLSGVIVDEAGDLILFGRVDPNSPPLQLDDFVVALRSAWLKYAELKGDVLEYSTPGCSIDPYDENVRNLHAIGQQIGNANSFAAKDKYIAGWKRECEKEQAVRVLGIPFDTHFAQVMVKADYDLKRLSDGVESVDVPGFVSLADKLMHDATTALSQRQPVQLPGFSMNRFWLYPGENVYEEDAGVFFLKDSPVTLQTELMHSDRKGKVSGSGMAEPEAYRFVTDFTLLYGKIASDKTVYQELEALFRFVSIAGIIKEQVGNNPAFDLSYLLDSYQVRETPVARTLPGRHSVKEYSDRREERGGYSEVRLWLPSCGGVDINVEKRTNRDKTGLLAQLKTAIAGSKPAAGTLQWSHYKEPEDLSNLELNAHLYQSNQVNKNNLVVAVVHKPDGYVVYDGQTEPLYSGDDMTELVRVVKAKASSENKEPQAFLKDFPDRKRVESFLSTYETQSERYNLIKNPLVDTGPDFITQTNLVFRPGVQLNKAASYIEPITQGEHQGKHRLVLSFFARAGRTIHNVVIHVIAETRAAADAFFAILSSHFGGPNSSSTRTLADIIDETHRELKQRYPQHKIIQIYLDQYGARPQTKLDSANVEVAS